MTTYTTRTVNLKRADGSHIRKATCVRADWGTGFTEVTFTELMPKGKAIEQAKLILARDKQRASL